MIIGQMIYDLVGVNGYTSTNKNNIADVVTGPKKNEGAYANNKIDVTSNLVIKSGQSAWNKIGIQAPSGAVFNLNNRTFRMGNTEVYELDEADIPITSLYFVDSNIENVIIDYIVRD